jgi:hypothetical protein
MKAIARGVTNVAPRTNVAASNSPLTDYAAAQGFHDAVIPFSAGDLAQAAKRTKNAAKGWKDGSRCPSGASLLNMARSMDCVWEWMCAEAERGVPGALNVDSVIRWAHASRKAEGMAGDVARAVLRSLAGDEPEEAPASEPLLAADVVEKEALIKLRKEKARLAEESRLNLNLFGRAG